MTTVAVETMTVSFPQRRVRPRRPNLAALNIWSVYFRNVKEAGNFSKSEYHAKCICPHSEIACHRKG
jgi:hypothetical protein